MKLQAFYVIALLHPQDQAKVYSADTEEENTELVAGPLTILAADEDHARVLAGRQIDVKYLKYMHRIEVVVRPF